MAVWSFIAAAVAGLVLAPQDVLGHGWMAQPNSRHLCNIQKLGRVTTTGGLNKPYFCGWKDQDDNPCDVQASYQEGATMELRYGIRANHGGFLMARVCTDPNYMSESCFDQHILKTTEGSDRWYIREDDAGREGEFWVSQWQLPEGLSCEHCVLSVAWYCAQHCTIPCDEAECGPIYSAGRNPYGNRGSDYVYNECPAEWAKRTTGPRGPQTFSNCADIKIQANGSTPPGTPPPALPPVSEEESMSDEEQEEMVQEEEDETGMDVSPAGMADDLKCSDDKVAEVLLELNMAREDNEYPRLECTDRSTGVAANWAYLMAENEELSSDREANCEMSRFEEDCLELVADVDPNTSVLETTELQQSDILSYDATHVGIGYYEEGGKVWWTILVGSDSGEESAEAPVPEEKTVPVVSPAVPGPDTGDDCCPADEDCLCGRCSAPLPAGQVVACSADSEGKTCCDEESDGAATVEATNEAEPPASPASGGGGTVTQLGSWLSYWSQR